MTKTTKNFLFLKAQHGISLVETIFCLLIVSIVSAASLKEISIQAKLNSKISEELNNRIKLRVISTYFDKINANQNSFPFFQAIRIGNPGRIDFTNGEPNPIHQSKEMFPATDSQSVTTAKIDFSALLVVNRFEIINEQLSVEACLLNQETQINISEIRSYLAVSADGGHELTGELNRKGTTCFEGTLHKTPSMLFNQPAFVSLRYLAPIKSLNTLYVSAENELRFLSHAGGINIENQPIVNDVLSLRAQLGLIQHSAIHQQKIISEVKFKNGKVFPVVTYLNFTQKDFTGLLLLPLIQLNAIGSI